MDASLPVNEAINSKLLGYGNEIMFKLDVEKAYELDVFVKVPCLMWFGDKWRIGKKRVYLNCYFFFFFFWS